MTVRQTKVVIIGAGMSGICAGITLQSAGIEDVTIYEKADRVGGTWRENSYPGLTCDIPSRLYQYTFATNPDWSRMFSPGPEIDAYFADVARRSGIEKRIQFGAEVISARFGPTGWIVRTRDGKQSRADFLISATGVLHHPKVPAIAGLDEFSGHIFHSARWDHSIDLRGRRVGVIGTGSTGVQLICGLAGIPAKVSLFQRTAQWIVPLPNFRYPRRTRVMHRNIPWLDRLGYRFYANVFEVFAGSLIKPGLRRRVMGAVCWANLHTVRDRELRKALTPNYAPMCKRLVVSGQFYRCIQRDDVELISAGIDRFERRGIVTNDGVLHELDVIVLATGFDAHAYTHPIEIVGHEGVRLEDQWRDGPRVFQTVTVPSFPNFFMLLGPYSPVGNFALTAVAESQANHATEWIQRWRRGEFDTIEPTVAATDAFNSELAAAMPRTVWTTGCDSWYFGKSGLPEVWPFTPSRHRKMLGNPQLSDYNLHTAPTATAGSNARSLP